MQKQQMKPPLKHDGRIRQRRLTFYQLESNPILHDAFLLSRFLFLVYAGWQSCTRETRNKKRFFISRGLDRADRRPGRSQPETRLPGLFVELFPVDVRE